jgi:hypothetical protein
LESIEEVVLTTFLLIIGDGWQMKITRSNGTYGVEESSQNKMNDLLILQTAEHGSNELVDAVDRLIDAEEEELVDKILSERWPREIDHEPEREYTTKRVKGAPNRSGEWIGARQYHLDGGRKV